MVKKYIKKAIHAGRRGIKTAFAPVFSARRKKHKKKKHIVFRSAKKVVIFEWPEKKR
jgi:hypothetical protein